MNKTSKRILAIGMPLAAVAATGAAFAYWSGSGTGSGGATAAAQAEAVTLAPTSAITGLVPGGSVSVPVTATNPNKTTSVSITTLTAVAVKSNTTECDLVAGASVSATSPTAAVIVPPAGTAGFGSITVAMSNSTIANQDACKGAVFTATLSAS